MKKIIAAAAAALALAVVPAQAEKLKVGFVYVGPVGDHGWSYQHNQGRLAVEEALGD
ncbi:MAG TPA: BMP family ABC transporter substrate-binding protein, partial [Hyphomicrobiales bacterium]|nr:BMP family ABC transporter substrate-binding protein [Hyphomicrobiales bacterium]